MKRVLITGAAGMVGSHLIDFLLENTDFKIYGMCRWNDSTINLNHLLSEIEKKDRINIIYGDITDQSSVINVLRESEPDYIFHLAAQSYPHTSFTSPADTLNTNIIGTCNIFESIRLLDMMDVSVHNCSSSEVFGKVDILNVPIAEDTPYHPASPYAISKVGADLLGKYYYDAYGMKIITTRMFTHTGPRRADVFHESTFAKQLVMIEKGMKKPIVEVGNLESLRTYADVRDAVRAYYTMLVEYPKFGEYYNIGGEYTCTVGDTLNFLIDKSATSGVEVVVDEKRLRPVDADLQIPNLDKFKKDTNWKPIYSYEETMTDLLNYWRSMIW